MYLINFNKYLQNLLNLLKKVYRFKFKLNLYLVFEQNLPYPKKTPYYEKNVSMGTMYVFKLKVIYPLKILILIPYDMKLLYLMYHNLVKLFLNIIYPTHNLDLIP